MATVTAKELNRNVSRLRREAMDEPVYITERGVVTHALVSIEYLERNSSARRTALAALTPSGGGFLSDEEAALLSERNLETAGPVEL